ncbi:MAG: ABC transporter substrate-binding protein [Tagaea sp.]|nr:ABC transporter substrate-binding protein [Tagaea sp.]
MIRALALLLLTLAASPAGARFVETPSLAAEVAAGRLPPVEKRLPETPLVTSVARADWTPGRHGGEIRLLSGRTQDTRLLAVYGYARLVGYDHTLNLVPDILESVRVEADKVFVLTLRAGHRWSDGAPFTSEDFRFWWEDVANNREIATGGLVKELLAGDKPPRVTFPDARTIVFEWDAPNPAFLPALAGPTPLYIYRPAHYLKQLHAKYADPERLREAVRRANARSWAQLFNRSDKLDRNDNPDLPTLDPWMVRTRAPSERFVFERNPFYHRVDEQGRQLPYIDRAILTVADGKILPAKTGAGEADLQARNINFSNYTFLRQAGKRNGFETLLWNPARGAHIALYPNLNANDPVWRGLARDVRFRRALSLAIDRREINQVVYFGLGIVGANTVLPASPLYESGFREGWHRFDLAAANRLLDEIGLTKRDDRGVRLLPDGRPLEIVVETAGEDSEQTDVLELIHDSWLRAGMKLYSRPQQRAILRNRVYTGDTRMSVWSGIENGLPTADTAPDEFAPVEQIGLQWPKWGQYVETSGRNGEPADLPEARELLDLAEAWRNTAGAAGRAEVWKRILANHAENVWSIGIVAGVRQPIVVSHRLRNVPREGIWAWDPGAFFGMHRMDTFWFDGERDRRNAAAAGERR